MAGGGEGGGIAGSGGGGSGAAGGKPMKFVGREGATDSDVWQRTARATEEALQARAAEADRNLSDLQEVCGYEQDVSLHGG